MILPKIFINKILYATDLSKSSIHAFAYAVSLANQFGAEITMLHVLSEKLQQEGIIRTLISDEQWNEIKQRHYEETRDTLIGKKRDHVAIKDVLHSFTENVRAESDNVDFLTDEIIVEYGEPVETILKTADKRHCDLIVMGSHGHGGFVDALIGSTARRVVRRSNKPVMVVKLPE